MSEKPNVVVLFPDQLRAQSLRLYGSAGYSENQIETPNIDRLAASGVTLDNAFSNCPVCTPARAMLVTGRYPQSTGHLINSTRTRHSEISIADAFSHQGYETAWVGKWHLHTGHWPALNRTPMQPDWVPKGRDRLGFEYWRAYNQHMVYFDGFVQKGDWNYERWKGYETEGLLHYAFEFMDEAKENPFLLFLSPHQPHYTPEKFAPDRFYAQLPKTLTLPGNVPEALQEMSIEMYRHYLAMILAIDEMLGKLIDYLDAKNLLDNTILVFSSDHGTQGGSQGVNPWSKKNPYDASIHIPAIISYPQKIDAGTRTDTLMGMVDFFPTLCALAGVPIPTSVEGSDLSSSLINQTTDAANATTIAKEIDAQPSSVFLMNFSKYFDWFQDGAEWRGVRTKTHMYCRRLDGTEELYDIRSDPLQMDNLVANCDELVLQEMKELLDAHQAARHDELVPCSDWANWLDEQRRVIRNAKGELSHPESTPDWSQLEPLKTV
jgi:arylsulfatase A-like enzyme